MTDASEYAKRFEAHLRSAGVRMTRQRVMILRVLAETDDHPHADEIFNRASAAEPTISLSTVYRTMRLLEERGTIHRYAFNDRHTRFAQADREHRDHLIDIETGRVIGFRSERIERLRAEIAADLGYDIVRHRLELYCKKRRSKPVKAPAPRRTRK